MKKLLLISLMILMTSVGCITIVTNKDDQKPTAIIDSISPAAASPGATINFVGHGTDLDSPIVAFRWRSDSDGELSTLSSFDTASLSEGVHTVYFKVQNERGAWSDEITGTVSISMGAASGPPGALGTPGMPGSPGSPPPSPSPSPLRLLYLRQDCRT